MSYTLKGKIVRHLDTKTGEGKKGAWANAKFVVEEVDVKSDYSISSNTNFEAEEIQQLIDVLPEGYRIVFNMSVIEGYKHHEIAKILNISEGTSKSQLFKARKLLQQKIKEINKTKYGTR